MTEFTYKDIVIGFTTSFKLIWHDKGSLGSYDGAYWRPEVPEHMKEFYPVGDLGWKGYDDLKVNAKGEAVIVVVKDAKGFSGSALRRPIRYKQVWNDKATGAANNGSMWRPEPPKGYVALGLVCNLGYDAPSLDAVRCVRADLVVRASPGDEIWRDQLTGGNPVFWPFKRIVKNITANWFGSWRIKALPADAGEVHFSAGTFIGANSYDPPTDDPNAYALRILIPEETQQSTLPEPVLRGYSKPPDFEEHKVASASILPWFAVNDPTLTPVTQVVKSPTYKLRRVDRYKLIGFSRNDTTTAQELSWSYTKGTPSGSNTATFSKTTGIDMGVKLEVEKVGGASATLSKSFTHTESSTSGWQHSETSTVDAKIPPGKAVAAYAIRSTYELFREDGSQVSTAVEYDNADNLLWKEYPPAPMPETAVKTD